METINITLQVPAKITRKVAGHEFTLDVATAPAETLVWQFLYGTRGLNDAANAAKHIATDKGARPDNWTLADSRGYVDAWHDGSIATRVSRGSGASVLDPVKEEARRLVTADIIAKLGGLTWAKAAETDKGKLFFTITPKGNVTRNNEAIDAMLVKYDDVKRYTERAKAIVAAKASTDDDFEL